MKLLALITGGRNGSSLFLSLLDGHSQIMQFPGTFLFDDFYEQIKNEKNSNIIAQSFIRFEPFFLILVNIIGKNIICLAKIKTNILKLIKIYLLKTLQKYLII